METTNPNLLANSAKHPLQSQPMSNNTVNNQKGFLLPILLGALILLVIIGGGVYYLGKQRDISTQNIKQEAPAVTNSSTTVDTKFTTFQNLLEKNCLNQPADMSLSGEIALNTLPISIKLSDLKNNKGNCDSYFSKYIDVSLGEENSFLTISDKNSNHCCQGPSSITSAGKLIKTQEDVNIYIHTGTWIEGPDSGYKPIIVRGVKNMKLNNGEEIIIVLDRKALDTNDISLQRLEDKYKIIDPNFDSGLQVLTPDTVDQMLMDSFFSNFAANIVVKNIEADLQNITLKN